MPIISVENLSKKYSLKHKAGNGYVTFREELVRGAKGLLKKVFKPSSRLSQSDLQDFWALREVNFKVEAGDRLGIIGHNGAGKSTLLKILSRIVEPTTGRITIDGRIASLLEVGTGFHPELTGRENIFLNGAILGLSKSEIKRKFDEIVDFAEVAQFLDTPVKRYSSGMYVRLAFAVAAHLESEILIVDEVLAVGDAQFQEKCLGKMDTASKDGRTVLFVSHNMGIIKKFCNRGLYLDAGRTSEVTTLDDAVARYLSHVKSNHIAFNDRPLKYASIEQRSDGLEITAEYEVNEVIKLPCLGFVISDQLGNPICGSNPVVDPPIQTIVPVKSGQVKVLVHQPKLLDGTYRLSLWFGNGREEFFHEKDCLLFDVINMAGQKQLPPAAVGAVMPKCSWHFS